MRTLVLIGMLTGCSAYPNVVTMSGTLQTDRFTAEAFGGANLEILDGLGGAYDETTTDAQGRFQVEAPGATDIFAIVSGEGHARASFSGASGIVAEYKVEDGSLWGFTAAELAEWEDRFAGCPGAGEGTLILGEVRAYALEDENGEPPIVASAVAEGYDPNTEIVYPACYLDSSGEAYLPGADRTGTTGIFAIWGVPEGRMILSVGAEFIPGNFTWSDTPVWLEDGGVAPRFPLLVDYPI